MSRYRLQYHNPPPFSAHEVLPGIWLGNFEDSLQADELRRRNVTHILSVAVGLYPHHQALVPDAQEWAGFEHMVVRALDKDGQDLLSYFPVVHGFIEEGRRSGGAVLVHCMAGISRSATCLISYIMLAEGLSFNDTLALVKGKRTIVSPNSGFRRQLEAFERQLQKKEKNEDNDEPIQQTTVVGEDEVEVYTGSWMKAEIIRWHGRDRRLEVVCRHEGDWVERTRGWVVNGLARVWAYHLRRFGKCLQRFVRGQRAPVAPLKQD